jgi:hypothetical protein
MELHINSSIFGLRRFVTNIRNTNDREHHAIKLELQNHAAIITTEKSFIKYNKKLKCLARPAFDGIAGFYTQWFSVCSNITSKFRTITILKSYTKQNNDSIQAYRHVYDLPLHQTSLI